MKSGDTNLRGVISSRSYWISDSYISHLVKRAVSTSREQNVHVYTADIKSSNTVATLDIY